MLKTVSYTHLPLPEDGLFAEAGDGRGLLGRRAALAAGALAQPAHQMRGDDHPLDLVGALVDGGDLGVAVGPLHLHALEEAAAAVDLQGVVGDLQCCLLYTSPLRCWDAPEMPQAMYRLPVNFCPDIPT